MGDRRVDQSLASYGSDLTRWPDHAVEARAALLAEPDFRRAFERERELDRALTAHRVILDAEVSHSGAVARLKRETLKHHSANFLTGMPWRRVAAGVLLAGMLGGALDLMLPDPPTDPLEMAMVDPLDAAGSQ